MTHVELFQGTQAGAPGREVSRTLSAALVDGEDEGAASMFLHVVDGPMRVGPSSRDEFSAAVVRHYADELGLKFSMESAERVSGPVPRVEILGILRREELARRVWVVGFEGAPRHVVVTFSVPSGRWEAMRGAMTASLDTFRPLAPVSHWAFRWAAVAAAGALVVALAASLLAVRRRREEQEGRH